MCACSSPAMRPSGSAPRTVPVQQLSQVLLTSQRARIPAAAQIVQTAPFLVSALRSLAASTRCLTGTVTAGSATR